ncbi:conserved Plasmodium protein, unknown function [Plasmodium ovale wallikeri]|uniref:Uncharacterized protein n=1 Tax=Plasmodium ovale wallikeri TaxID=864142 RepID=A0A1A8YLW3_PLAOA|nr:conserved Plasmodium protein, unknown function [Plasmodium ovale wallikeri]
MREEGGGKQIGPRLLLCHDLMSFFSEQRATRAEQYLRRSVHVKSLHPFVSGFSERGIQCSLFVATANGGKFILKIFHLEKKIVISHTETDANIWQVKAAEAEEKKTGGEDAPNGKMDTEEAESVVDNEEWNKTKVMQYEGRENWRKKNYGEGENDQKRETDLDATLNDSFCGGKDKTGENGSYEESSNDESSGHANGSSGDGGSTHYEKTIRGENEISDISTDEMLSGMESESDDEDVHEDEEEEADGEEVRSALHGGEITLLSEEIKKKEKMLEEENRNIWNLKNRFSKMEKYITWKRNKIKNMKKSIDEKSKVEAEESTMCKNVQLKNIFLQKEHKKLKGEREKNNEKIVRLQNELVTCDGDIEEIKKKLSDKEKELNEWINKINKIQKEEYEIEKFRLCKDKEIEKLSFQMEKLSLEKVEKEKKYNIMKTANMKLKIEMNSTISQKEEMKKEKKDLGKKWKCILNSIHSRDKTILEFEEEFKKYINREKKLRQKYEHITKRIDTQKNKNNKLNEMIKNTQMNLHKLRKEEADVNNTLQQLLIQKDVLNKNMDHEKFHFKEKIEEKKNLENSLNELIKTYDKLILSSDESKKEFIKEEGKNFEKNELIKSSEKILEKEQNKLAILIGEIKLMDQEKFRLSQSLQKSKSDYAILETDVVGTQIKIKQMKNNIKKVEKELERQKEIIYKFDFHTQILTKKLNIVSGISTFEKKKENQKKIVTLEKELAKYEDIYNTVNNEIKRINVELKNIKMYQVNMKDKKLNNRHICEKLQLDIKSLENNVINQKKEKENAMLVELNLKIELDKLKTIFEKHLHNLHNLKEQKNNEIKKEKLNEQDRNAHIESLKIIIKNINDEIHKLSVQLSDKKNKCNNLEVKLNSIIALNREKDQMDDQDERDSENKHIYYKIKIEEDIVKLKEEINNLDEKIDRETTESNNFQKTLNDILQANKTFSDNIKYIDPQYKVLLKKKKKLNKKLNEINHQIETTEKNINQYNEKVNNTQKELNAILTDNKHMEEKIANLKENSQKMENTINDIFIKIDRASNQLKSLIGTKQKKGGAHVTIDCKEEIGDRGHREDKDTVNHTENVSLEKKVFKQIQMESLKEKLALLLECFKDYGDNAVVKEVFHLIEAS